MAKDYYKALRPDGTDFATGKTKPRKGRWMPRINDLLVMCVRGYHVSDAPAETLVNGSWPCKLARVEIPDGEWEREGHKFVVPTYRVVEWLPAWQALGPNGEAVAALIERAGRLTQEEFERLSAAWSAAESAAESAAWSSARSAALSAGRSAVSWAARALIVRDLISPEQFDTLYDPWASVIGDTHG